MARRTRTRGSRVAVAVVIAAAVVVGGALALRGVDDERTPSATTMDAATDAAGSAGATAAATTGPPPSDDASTAGSPGPEGIVVFPVSGPDLPGANVLAQCDSDRRAAVAQYTTDALGAVVMQCGDSGQGYRHITIRHERDWDDELAATTTGRDWDDLMLSAVQVALTQPGSGLPTDAGDGKVCYAAPIRFADGSTPPEGFVKVIVSATTDRVITAYPTRQLDC